MKQNNIKKTLIINKTALIVGAICAGAYFAVQLWTGSPIGALHVLGTSQIMPPIWLFNVFRLIWAFLSGYAAGSILSASAGKHLSGSPRIEAYRGGLFFISTFFLSLVWYPLLFATLSLFFSFAVSLVSAVLSGFCAASWQKINGTSGFLMWGNTVWLVYVCVICFSILFKT